MIFQSEDFVMSELPGKAIVFVNSKKPASDEEFRHVIDFFGSRRSELKDFRCLAISDGAGPTLKQRQLQQQEFGDVLKSIPTAIVSDAITIRFVVSSAALFVKNIKAFEVERFDDALGFLGYTPDVFDDVKGTLANVTPGNFKTLDRLLQR